MLLTAMLLTMPSALAGDAVDLGGKAYLRYSVDLTDGSAGDNAFAIDRVYLTARSKLEGDFAFRVTLDVGREKTQVVDVTDSAGDTATVEVPAETKLQAFLKYAYLQYALPVDGVTLRAGMAPTAWVGFTEHFWGKRWVSKTFTDWFGLQSSSDLGVQVAGRHADGLLGWQAEVINGEGYAHPEVDASKTAQLRVNVDPIRGDAGHATVAAFGSYEWIPDADPVLVAAGGAGYAMKWLLLWGEAAARSEGGSTGWGWSVIVQPQAPGVGALFLRYDHWDPDTVADHDATSRWVVGVSRGLVEGVDLGLDYERVQGEPGDDFVPAPEHGVHLRMQAKF